jgi:Ca2+-binding RTX toxin-like protein
MSTKTNKGVVLCALLAVALVPAIAQAAPMYSLTIVGGDRSNEIHIGLSSDESEYVIRANGPIAEVADCRNPADDPTELRCPVSQISSFVVRAQAGNDSVLVAKAVAVSTFLYGGEGHDELTGGDDADKLVGNEGADTLTGRDGDDFLYGHEGDDSLFGGHGNDVVRGGPGRDDATGGHGRGDDVEP